MSQHKLNVFNPSQQKWASIQANLPTNPSNNKRAVLLVPKTFLSDAFLTINKSDFANFLWANYEDSIREQFSFDVKSELKVKRNIIAVIQAIRQSLKDYQAEIDSRDAEPYNLATDPRGVYRWEQISRDDAFQHHVKLGIPKNDSEFEDLLSKLAADFKAYIEVRSGVKHLWYNGKPKSQAAARYLLQGLIANRCQNSGIQIARPDHIGKRQVEFAFASTGTYGALLAIKRMGNGRYLQAFERLVRRVHSPSHVVLILIAFTGDELARTAEAQRHIAALAKQVKCEIRLFVVDGTQGGPPKPISA